MNLYSWDIKKHLEAVFVIFIGFLIYILLRPKNIIAFLYIQRYGLMDFVNTLRSPFEDISFPLWFLYSLPDGLWAYATLITVLIIFRKTIFVNAFGFLTAFFLLFSEGIQYFVPKVGTYDATDMLFVSLGVTLAYARYFILLKSERGDNNEKSK